jgi:hypothetical protein
MSAPITPPEPKLDDAFKYHVPAFLCHENDCIWHQWRVGREPEAWERYWAHINTCEVCMTHIVAKRLST